MSTLVDTNILLRRTQPDHESHQVAVESVAKLIESGEAVYYSFQIIAEFWNVVTRPAGQNGLGFTSALALREVERIESLLLLLPESAAAYAEWKRLVQDHRVLGSKVHDAKLVALMKVHGVRRILTFNTSDFVRYGIDAAHPTQVLAQTNY